jgi:hypothetical protein
MNKSTLLAVLVFVALAVGAVSTMREKPERGITRISFTQIDPDAVDRLVIRGADEVVLTREGELWKINGKRADGSAVERILESIAGLSSSDLATESEERFAELEVNEEKGTAVQVFLADQKLAELVIGSSARGGSHVRVGDAVYTVRGIHRAAFAREADSWIEKRIFFDDVDAVTRVEVALADQPAYALVKEDAAWKLEDPTLMPPGERFDADLASRLIRSLVGARAAELLDEDPGAAAGLGAGADQLRFSVGDAEQRSLALGSAQEDGAVYARSSEREPVLTIRQGTVAELRKTVRELRDLSLLAFDTGTVEKIAIGDGASSLTLEKDGGGWRIAESSQTVEDDYALDVGAVHGRISRLAGLKALAEADASLIAEGGGFDDSAASVSLSGGADDPATLTFGATVQWDDREVVLARGSVDDRTYLVEPYIRDQVLGGLASLKQRPAPPGGGLGGLDPQALQNLPPEVRESLLKQMQQQAQQEAIQRAMEAQAAQQ